MRPTVSESCFELLFLLHHWSMRTGSSSTWLTPVIAHYSPLIRIGFGCRSLPLTYTLCALSVYLYIEIFAGLHVVLYLCVQPMSRVSGVCSLFVAQWKVKRVGLYRKYFKELKEAHLHFIQSRLTFSIPPAVEGTMIQNTQYITVTPWYMFSSSYPPQHTPATKTHAPLPPLPSVLLIALTTVCAKIRSSFILDSIDYTTVYL